MKDSLCVEFLQWALPRMQMRWPGFRKVRRQVCRRIGRRLRELGLPDPAAYRTYLEVNPMEWQVLDGFCRISISRFYRDRGVFDAIREKVLPALAAMAENSRPAELRCWGAGCASGEEAYTISALWKLCVGPQFPGVQLNLIITDSDQQMLKRARRGCYQQSSLKDFPRDWLPVVFTREDDQYHIKPEFCQGIDFQLQDIRREMPSGEFHLILCRHLVFTYFDEELQWEILQQLTNKLVPGGFLVTGKQEPLPRKHPQLKELLPRMGIYRKSI